MLPNSQIHRLKKKIENNKKYKSICSYLIKYRCPIRTPIRTFEYIIFITLNLLFECVKIRAED